MKKTLLVLFILIFTLSSAIALSSCKTEEEAELKEWTVEFIVDGHVYSNAVAKEGQSLTLPVSPEKAGYDFGGWYIDESFTKEYTESYFVNNSPEDNLRVYAKWTRLDVEISSASMTVDGLSMTLTVPHSSESFDFGADLTVSSFADWILSPDQYGMQSIITKVAPLTEGSNTYYIHVSREGEITTYTVEIYRNHLYRVEFDTLGGEELEPISVEEGQLIPTPAVSRPGYSLVGWDYDLTDPVTSDLTLSAVWAPNDDTLYTVEHYLEKLGGGYELYRSETLYGTTDTTASYLPESIDHFTFRSAEATNADMIIESDGSLLIKLYYTRNSYTVTATVNGTSAEGAGTYPYGAEVTLSATVAEGYSFSGWIENGLVASSSTQYTFTIDGDRRFNATVTPMSGVAYTVEHYRQGVDGEYRMYRADTLYGVTDTLAVFTPDEYEHFTFDPESVDSASYIKGDGSLVIKLYYVRSRYTVTATVNGTSAEGAGTYPYGAEVTVSLTLPDGYIFSGWMENSDLVYTGIAYTFTLEGDRELSGSTYPDPNTLYTVEHYLEKLSGGYELYRSETLYGTTDTTASYLAESIDHFTFCSAEATNADMIIEGDGSLVIRLYYNRSTHTVSAEDGVEIEGAGTYPYGSEVTLTFKDPAIGYIYGWYNANGLFSDLKTVTVTVTEDLIARRSVAPEMEIFAFTSDSKVCVIDDLLDESVTDVVIPSCVTKIGTKAFANCINLKSVTVGDNVTEIGGGAFEYSNLLETVSFGNGISGINTYMFRGCSALKSVSLGENIVSVGNYAFYQCSSLESIVLPDKVQTVGTHVFYECSSLRSVDFGDGVASIGKIAFFRCSSLKSIVIPEGVVRIEDETFAHCASLISVTLPSTVTEICSKAFSGCTSLIEIANLSSIEITLGYSNIHGDIGYHARFVHNGPSRLFTVRDFLFYPTDEKLLLILYRGNESTILLPDLEETEGVSYVIDSYAFAGDFIKSVEFSNAVYGVNKYAFSGCECITDVLLNDELVDLHYDAFPYLPDLNYNNRDGLLYIGSKNNPYLVLMGARDRTITSFTLLPETVFIGNSGLDGCKSLQSVTLHDGLRGIGDYAFSKCKSLTYLVIPASVKSVGDWVFSEVQGLVIYVSKEADTSGWSSVWCNMSNTVIYCDNPPTEQSSPTQSKTDIFDATNADIADNLYTGPTMNGVTYENTAGKFNSSLVTDLNSGNLYWELYSNGVTGESNCYIDLFINKTVTYDAELSQYFVYDFDLAVMGEAAEFLLSSITRKNAYESGYWGKNFGAEAMYDQMCSGRFYHFTIVYEVNTARSYLFINNELATSNDYGFMSAAGHELFLGGQSVLHSGIRIGQNSAMSVALDNICIRYFSDEETLTSAISDSKLSDWEGAVYSDEYQIPAKPYIAKVTVNEVTTYCADASELSALEGEGEYLIEMLADLRVPVSLGVNATVRTDDRSLTLTAKDGYTVAEVEGGFTVTPA